VSAAVLFVDDDEANLVVCEAATSDAFQVLTAPSAQAALELMRQNEVGVLVADQRMPGTTGMELLEQVSVEFPETIRILITAYSDLRAAIDAINRGQVRRYLRKPWEPEELLAELRDALNVYETTRKLHTIERRLRENERVYSLGVVAAGIAHELRNPIGWISNNLTLVRSGVQGLQQRLDADPADDELRQEIADILEGLEDASKGVTRITEIVRGIELPTRPRDEETADLGEVVELALRVMHSDLRRAARLELDVQRGLHVAGSSTQLGQIVLNLLVNALQAVTGRSPAENVIRVSLKSDGDGVHLEVSDNGPGIDSDNLDRVFDPFFTTKRTGSGLGLAITRTIVDELKGDIHADHAPGGGALFRLSLPAARAS
jgi:signal transduction histidine kinase